MNLLSIDNNTASRFYRLIPQMKWMREHGHEVRMIAHDDQNMDVAIRWADVVLFQMVFSPEVARECKKLGKKVLFECDDLLHTVPKTHYSYEETKGWGKVKWLWRIVRTLWYCDGFITTTPALVGMYGWMVRRRLVFPNALDLHHWLKEPKKNLGDTVRILWAGSTSHVGDLNQARPVIKRILDKYPQAKFVYIGMGGAATDDLYAQFIYGEDFFADIPKDRRESVLPVSGHVWPYILSSLQADIAIAPLEKNHFNKHKSQCKYLEYAINEIPGVYSRHHYTDVQDGVTGLLADTEDEWVDKLSILIESAMLRQAMGRRAKEDAIRRHNIKMHMYSWQHFVEQFGPRK